MAVLTVQTPTASGLVLSLVAAAGGGDSYPNSGREQLIVNNGGGGAITVTFTSQANCSLGSIHSGVGDSGPHTVAAGATRYFPGIDPNRYNDANGRVNVAYSGVTSVTVGVMRST